MFALITFQPVSNYDVSVIQTGQVNRILYGVFR